MEDGRRYLLPKLRLLKLIIQPVFVVDDGEGLTELTAEPVVVAAQDWPDYPRKGFQDSFEKLRAQVEDSGPSGDAGA
jgi:hypothetical protein